MGAALQENTDILNTLLAGGADVKATNNEGKSPLINAVEKGNLDAVKALLAKGADVNRVTNFGWTALLLAAGGGYAEIVKALLDKGADVNARIRGNTALSMATQRQKADIVQLLINAGTKQ